MSDVSKAVFLSYASQDAAAAARICEALRAAGIEVWFDQSELRGGDAWDRQIRRQIHECALFMPIISAHSQERLEGYFRREWRLAVERSHDMAEEKAFLVPVVIDDTSERHASVPDRFRETQWTRLPGGETPASFCEQMKVLLRGEVPAGKASGHATPERAAVPRKKPPNWTGLAVAVLVTGGVSVLAWRAMQPRVSPVAPMVAMPIAVAVPDKSIAVLPFVDMSERHDQEYFSDGLSDELIDLLSKIQGLRVPARTSSFYFKGKPDDIATIAARLHVAHVLEGSVRRAGSKLRVTVQLVRADSGYHVWSETYDRKWDDVFKVQDEIATAVVKALTVSLLGGPLPQSKTTVNGEAYTLFLQARSAYRNLDGLDAYNHTIRLLEQSVKLDPGFAPTWALLSRIRIATYTDLKIGSLRGTRDAAYRAARRAVSLDPALAEGHVALGRVFMDLDWNWHDAEKELQRALELDHDNADVLRESSYLSGYLGRFEQMVHDTRSAAVRDPLNGVNSLWLGWAQYHTGNIADALVSYRRCVALEPNTTWLHADIAAVRLAQGQPSAALAEIDLETDPAYLALQRPAILAALGRASEAVTALGSAEAKYGESYPYQVGVMYAARNDLLRAFLWWNRAWRQHDPDLFYLKGAPIDARMPRLAVDPRYQELLRKMSLPET